MMRKILLLTPMYPSQDLPQLDTPVVHFFTREWVKQGVDVRVIHFPVNFPKVVYAISKLFFYKKIANGVGGPVRMFQANEAEYEYDGVKVKRIPMLKLRPHSRYSQRQINNGINKVIDYCDKEQFTPDVIISHLINPQVEIMYRLKQHYHVPTCYVAHDSGADLKHIYSKEANRYIDSWDLIGYRSRPIKSEFEAYFNVTNKPTFLCFSGIPEKFLPSLTIKKDFTTINSFVFVGSLVTRKYPEVIIPAVYAALGNNCDYKITYVGKGEQEPIIKDKAEQYGISSKVIMTGKVPREEVISLLNSHQLFIMISKGEAYGLVYLEAMARGCITIASRNEGFDGIIKHGENGFLCDAGNANELSQIIADISVMKKEDLELISENAINTAKKMTDKTMAEEYLHNVMSIL